MRFVMNGAALAISVFLVLYTAGGNALSGEKSAQQLFDEADTLLSFDKTDEAASLFAQVRLKGGSIDVMRSKAMLARIALRKGDLKTAETIIDEIRPLAEKSGNSSEEYAWYCWASSECGYARGKYPEAESLAFRAYGIFSAVYGANHRYAALQLSNIGVILTSEGKYAEAEKALSDSLSSYLKNNRDDNPETAVILNGLGSLCWNKGEFDRAIGYYDKSLAVRIKIFGEGTVPVANVYNNLGSVYDSKGDYRRSFEYFGKARKIFSRAGANSISVATVENNMGASCRNMADYSAALTHYSVALGICERVLGKNHPLTATCYSNCGLVYNAKGDYDSAASYYATALEILETVYGKNHPSVAAVCNNMGFVHDSKGDFARAISWYERALAVYVGTSGEKHPSVPVLYGNIGKAYGEREDYDRALSYFNKSLSTRIAILGENNPDVALSYNNLGALYERIGDYGKAASFFHKALDLREKLLGENHPDMASSLIDLGGVYQSTGDRTRATALYERAYRIRSRSLGENHPDTAMCLNSLALLYDETGDPRAVDFCSRALAILERNRSWGKTAVVADNLGRMLAANKSNRDAVAAFNRGVFAVEKGRLELGSGKTEFTAGRIGIYYHLINACVNMNDVSGAFDAAEASKARGFLDRLSLQAALSAPGVSSPERNTLLAIGSRVESLVAQRDRELAKAEKDRSSGLLAELGGELEKAEGEFSAIDSALMRNARYAALRKPRMATLRDAENLCGDKDAIVEYSLRESGKTDRTACAIVIRKSGATTIRLDPSFGYSKAISEYRDAVKRGDRGVMDSISATLYGKIIRPVEKEISGAEELCIVPDGALPFLPFDALRPDANSGYLCERYAITMTPSVSVLMMADGRKYPDSRAEFLAFGGALYDRAGTGSARGVRREGLTSNTRIHGDSGYLGGRGLRYYYESLGFRWENLPGTKIEVNSIAESVFGNKSTVLVGQDVSEAKIKEMSADGILAKYRTIHFACHGYYDQEYPSCSALILSDISTTGSDQDGYLSVEEAAKLEVNADLVNLSACETGLGKIVCGDGVVGLARSFQISGANSVSVTLWTVDDEATKEFMIRVYSRVREKHIGYRDAVRETRVEFIREKINGNDYSDPYFWSPFVIYGR